MRIDIAKKEFFENYNEEAMQSIDNISKEYGLVINEKTIHLFNIEDAFNTFNQYLEGYCDYVIKNQNNENSSSRETICESAKKFINEGVFNESDVLYKDTPDFVKSYIEGIDKTSENIDKLKERMFESGVDNDMIGDISTFSDLFMESMNKYFTESMNKLLTASGYKYKHREDKKTPKPKVEFL